MTTRNESRAADYHDDATPEAILSRFREELPPEIRDVQSLAYVEDLDKAEAVVACYQRLETPENAAELLEAVVWNVAGVTADPNTDYARDVAGIIMNVGIAANQMARPNGERLVFTANRAEQYQAISEESTGYERQRLELLACQHNHVCHLMEGGMMNDVGYYSMALAMSALSPISQSMQYPGTPGGLSEELMVALLELHMLDIIKSALANDLLHYIDAADSAEERALKLADLIMRNEGVGALLRRDTPLPSPAENEPDTAGANLNLLNGVVRSHRGEDTVISAIVQRLSDRAANQPELAPQQLATARVVATAV